MSTRAQVKIVDEYGAELWFYRHSDGYPEGTMPTLEKFLGWVKEGKIRNNTEQAAGWLILIGAQEYDTYTTFENGKLEKRTKETLTEPFDGHNSWKCGAFEPCACRELHDDVEWLYTIDLKALTIEAKEV
jgi:hypothetical protein